MDNKIQLACLLLLCSLHLVQSGSAVKPVTCPSGKCLEGSDACKGSFVSQVQTCTGNQRFCTNIHQMQRTGECLEEELNIITRDSWGAKQPRKRVSMITPVDYFIIHHSAGFLDNRACDNLLDCIEEVKDIQKEHMDNGYVDIGYHYLIGGDGSVFEGRGWQYEGAHAFSYYNNISIGVCLIGNFNGKKPTNKATTALSKLNTCLQRIGKLNLTHSVYGHRDVRQTECPGDKYYPTLKETFGASWHREYPPPEYWSECRVNEGKCQNDALDCEGEYKVRTTKIGILPFGLHALPFGTLLCPEHEEDNRIKCCIKRT